MKNINEYSEKAGALFLIEHHTIGNLRDEADLNNAKYHAFQTVNFIEDLLLNIDGTIEEKIKFLSKIKEEIPKFYGKNNADVDNGHGLCKEKNCKNYATKDYNGHDHWVCDYHYTKLNDDFDEEYR